jgi:SAM-dependent methyltransferase
VKWVDEIKPILDALREPAEDKYLANAIDLPFPDRSIDLALLSNVVGFGLSKSRQPYDHPGAPSSFEIVREAARVLSPDGLLMVNFGGVQNPCETLTLLQEAGFDAISHVHRQIWYGGIPNDLYACRRASREQTISDRECNGICLPRGL